MRLLQSIGLMILLVTAFSSSARAQRASSARNDPLHDSQIWPDTQVSIGIRPNLFLVISGTARLGRDDYSAFVNEQVGVGLTRRLGRSFTTGFQYRYINSEPTPDRQSREHRLHVELAARAPLKWGVDISNRVRVERRDINRAISWRYRNRLQFERPFSIHEHRFIPYVSGEPYYDTRFQRWSRVQVFVGSRIPISKHVTFDGFYMRQFDARVRPGFLHVVGIYWRVEI
ncbi:MAG: DUF2490 domain-containing protein [Blastocatellia bacterium]